MKTLHNFILENRNILDETIGNLSIDHIHLTELEARTLAQYYNLSDISICVELPRLNKSNKYISLEFVQVKNKGNGIGSAFMKNFCKWADDNDRVLCLNPTDIYVGKKNLNRLIDFYKKFGFEQNEVTSRSKCKKSMIRQPNK